jgi:hypothetical protein
MEPADSIFRTEQLIHALEMRLNIVPESWIELQIKMASYL